MRRSRLHHGARAALVLATWWSAGCTTKESQASHSAQRNLRTQDSTRRATPDVVDSIDWKSVDRAMGRAGKLGTGNVYRYSLPRSDLKVTAQGVQIKPALSLGSWLALKPVNGRTVVAMGDLVLTEGEYNRVIARLQQGGVSQTAVHKHLPQHSPSLWWTHVEARGDPVKIAGAVHAALALTRTPPPQPETGAKVQPLGIDTTGIRQALGHDGKENGGVYQVSIPRAETIRAGGVEVPSSMGTATALNFQPTGSGKAAINGDFVMTAVEVDGIIQSLEANGIRVVALHNHLVDEEPRLFFLHFWANDDAVKLARGLRAAIDKMNLKKSG